LLLNDIRHRFLKLLGIAALLGCVFAVLALFPERVSTDRYTGDSGGKTVEYRVGWIKMSWEMVKKHPFLGVGVGNYFPEYNEYRRAAPDLVPRVRLKNHNGYMQVWAEMGTLGLLAYLAMMISIPFELLSTTRHQRNDGELRQIRCGVLVSFAVYVLMIGIIPVLEHEVAWVNIGLAMALGSIAPIATGRRGDNSSALEGAA
jgi:O-antigen ligase